MYFVIIMIAVVIIVIAAIVAIVNVIIVIYHSVPLERETFVTVIVSL